jgi:hypothetical protein
LPAEDTEGMDDSEKMLVFVAIENAESNNGVVRREFSLPFGQAVVGMDAKND